jgi:hypothetical protein
MEVAQHDGLPDAQIQLLSGAGGKVTTNKQNDFIARTTSMKWSSLSMGRPSFCFISRS